MKLSKKILAVGFIVGLPVILNANQIKVENDPFVQMDKIFEMQMRQMQMMREHMDKFFNSFEQNFNSSNLRNMPMMINSSGIFSSGLKDKGIIMNYRLNLTT